MVTNVGARGRVKTDAVCVQQIYSSLGRGISVLSALVYAESPRKVMLRSTIRFHPRHTHSLMPTHCLS